MVPDRRTLLEAVAGIGTLGLAGCSGFGQSTSTESVLPPGEPIRRYETQVVHVAGETGLFRWTASDSQPDDQLLLTETAARENVRFADGADRLATFADATAFDSASLALFERTFPECRRLGVRGARRRPDELRLDLCITRRPADVECRADRRRSGAVAVRLPVTDVDPSTLATSVGNECRQRLGPYRTATGDEA